MVRHLQLDRLRSLHGMLNLAAAAAAATATVATCTAARTLQALLCYKDGTVG